MISRRQAYLASQGKQMLRSAASEMSIPDVIPQIPVADDPFQKLLEAAWVLQESRDQKSLNQLPFDFGTTQVADDPHAVERITPPAEQPSHSLHSVPISLLPVPQPPTLLGSVTLSTDSFSEYGLEPPETDLRPEPVSPAVETEEIERASSAAEDHLRPPLRLRLNASQARIAGACAALVLTVMIYAVLRMPTSDPTKDAVASPLMAARAAELPKGTLPAATKTNARTTTAGTHAPSSTASVSSPTVQTRKTVTVAPASGPTSHKNVTDLNTRYALESMSRYEIQTLRRQAKYGDDSAALILGMAYETGHYVRQNCKTAAEWVERAARDGNPAAEYNLGLRYQTGDGVKADSNLASMWIRKSSLKKYAQAQSLPTTPSQR